MIHILPFDRTLSPNPHRELFTEEVPLDEMKDEVIQIAALWQKSAREKQLSASSFICQSIVSWLKETPEDTRILMCRDRLLGYVQAIALFEVSDEAIPLKDCPKKKYLSLVYLASHPINIRAPVNRDEPYRVEGAGSHVIRALTQIVQEENLAGIYTDTYESIPFYQKHRFQEATRTVCLPLGLDFDKNREESIFLDTTWILSRETIDTFAVEETEE